MNLAIDPALKAYPISRVSLQLRLFHSAVGTQAWFPLTHPNGAVFLDTVENSEVFLKRLGRQARDNKLKVEVHVYSPKRKSLSYISHNSFILHQSVTVREAVEGVQELRRSIRELARKAGTLDANRRLTVVLLDFSPQARAMLKQSIALQKELIDVLTNSEQERIFPFLLSEKAKDFPELILRTLSWTAYVGEENYRLAKAIFRLEEEVYNEKRQTIGLLRKQELDYLVPLHDVVFNPSAWKRMEDEFSEVEEKAYKKFLESL